MQHLLAKYAPELDLDDELRQRSESETVEGNVPGSSMRQPPLHPSPTGTFPLTDWASTLSPGRLPTVAAPRFSPNQQTPPPPPVLYPRPTTSTSTSEFLEKQPKHAAGYEWNERQTRTAIGNDGTASLSMEPDGEGYLGKPGRAGFFGYHAPHHRTDSPHTGFASGATLLRILQICAGGLSLAHINAESLPLQQSQHPNQWSPTYADKTAFVDAYFQLYHTQYPLVHEPTFRAQWSEVIPRPPHDQ